MKEPLHEELIKRTKQLLDILSDASTESVVSFCGTTLFRMTPKEGVLGSELASPFKQCFFLLGLMLTTPVPKSPKHLDNVEWKNICKQLNLIYFLYFLMFFPTKEESHIISDKKQMDEREIAMLFFTFYFNTGLIASIEQVVERIRNILCPFDQETQMMCGINPTKALEIAFWCSMFLQAGVDNMREISIREKEVRISLVEKWEKENWGIDTLREKAREGPWNDRAKELMDALSAIGTIPLNELIRVFGKEKATVFWNTFVSCRGDVDKFTYMTEKNPAESKPLFLIENGIVYCPSINALFISILNRFSDVLLKSEHRQSFLKRRDKFLENKTAIAFRQFFGNLGSIHKNIYETQTSQLEHDLIIISQGQMLIVENKASPAIEPFRDPNKAFKRIQHAFKKDQGIQEAFNQANRLRKRLLAGERVTLYDSKGEPLVTIDPANIQKIFCACVTADNFGPLATELSFLLEKETDEEYPWVINIFDLETFLGALSYRKWEHKKLFDYIASRISLHGKVLTADELEIAGVFINYGTLAPIIKTTKGVIMLTPKESLIFDQIYAEKHGGPKPNFSKPAKLVFTDFRKELEKRNAYEEPISLGAKELQKKIGRNDPCICGSGLKYKKCCGK